MRYRAAVFTKKKTIKLEWREPQRPGAGEVLIRNRACGVCGTDLHLYHGAPGSTAVTPPVVLGHEFSGDVEQVGAEVTDLHVGDQVTIDPNISCGRCWYCRSGERHLCIDLKAIGVNSDGGFAEYSLVPSSQVYRFDTKIPYHHAALAEPLACCLHGIDRISAKEGQSVAVVGTGAIGLIMVQLAFLGGASRVFASDPIGKRRNFAKQFGAIPVDPTERELPVVIRDSVPQGVDIAVECAGNPAAMAEAVRSVRRGGSVLLFSVPDVDAALSLDAYDIFHRELTITGSFINPATQSRAVELISSGKIQLEPLISSRLSLDSIEEAFQRFGSPEELKIVIDLAGQ